jgi:hypothetical protein
MKTVSGKLESTPRSSRRHRASKSTTTASTTMTANIAHVVSRATIPIASLAAAVYSIYDWHARALLAVVRDPLPHTLPLRVQMQARQVPKPQ